MFENTIDLDEYLQTLTQTGNWNGILQLGHKLKIDDKCRYLWAWPNEDSLKNLKTSLEKLNINKMLSVGCGSGLLEWIIQSYMGIQINGLEVDSQWWTSTYSPVPFIKLSYLENNIINEEFLNACCDTENFKFALMFCYFNNGNAFRQYMEAYQGEVVIIIGPTENSGVYTDPMPFDPIFNSTSEWKLNTHFEFCPGNILSIFVRVNLN